MPKKTNKPVVSRTQADRERIVNEVRFRLAMAELLDDGVAIKVLLAMLDRYVRDGTVYIDKWLNLHNGSDKAYHINLYNDKHKTDVVRLTDSQEQSSASKMSSLEPTEEIEELELETA
jgi:hypothetical protein